MCVFPGGLHKAKNKLLWRLFRLSLCSDEPLGPMDALVFK